MCWLSRRADDVLRKRLAIGSPDDEDLPREIAPGQSTAIGDSTWGHFVAGHPTPTLRTLLNTPYHTTQCTTHIIHIILHTLHNPRFIFSEAVSYASDMAETIEQVTLPETVTQETPRADIRGAVTTHI